MSVWTASLVNPVSEFSEFSGSSESDDSEEACCSSLQLLQLWSCNTLADPLSVVFSTQEQPATSGTAYDNTQSATPIPVK